MNFMGRIADILVEAGHEVVSFKQSDLPLKISVS
ncbi:unnamed protein product [Cylicostephanus goldi]|uniref:Uncharacterized protein n=1 Tax=Cylicostephanus goldi TaxID=71465 RepID=A0A3P6QJ25_CYLGO|nr:unnamed protein product [Cylicostephanus goldi]